MTLNDASPSQLGSRSRYLLKSAHCEQMFTVSRRSNHTQNVLNDMGREVQDRTAIRCAS